MAPSKFHWLAKPRSCLRVLGLAVLGLMMVAGPTAATTVESDLVWIVEGDVVSEDLYAVGNEIRIAGRVEGDLVAVATDSLLVEGVITGSVTAVASRVVISGEVGESVRTAAAEVTITGRVGSDLVVGTLGLHLDGEIGRDIIAAAWSGVAGGKVGRDLRGLFRVLNLSGEIGRDAEIRVDRLDAGERLSVLGDMDYQAAHLSGHQYLEGSVAGSLVNRRALPPNIRVRAFRLMVVLLMSLLMVLGGLVVVRMLSTRTETAVGRIEKRPLRSLGKGLIILLSPVLGLALVGVVLLVFPFYISGPLLLVAVPFFVVGLGAWLLAAAFSHIPVAVATGRSLGRFLGRKWDVTLAYLVGAAVFLLALQIPLLGLPVAVTVSMLGAGGWLEGRS